MMHYNFVVEGLQSWAFIVLPPTGLFPETHHPRLLQTVSFPPWCVFVFLLWRNCVKMIWVLLFVPKLLKDSSFLAPVLTRLTNFWIFQKGWETCSSWKWDPACRCFPVLILFFHLTLQDWRSVRTVYAAYRCWLLGHVVHHTLQWRKPRYGQVCVFESMLWFNFLLWCFLLLSSVFCSTSIRGSNTESAGWARSHLRLYHVSSQLHHYQLYCTEEMHFLRCINSNDSSQPLTLSCLTQEEEPRSPNLSSGCRDFESVHYNRKKQFLFTIECSSKGNSNLKKQKA